MYYEHFVAAFVGDDYQPSWILRPFEEYAIFNLCVKIDNPQKHTCISWWRHQMETFSALLAIDAGNSPVPGEFLAQRPVTRSFRIFFDLRLNTLLSKQSWGWWFEMLSRPLWSHCDVLVGNIVNLCQIKAAFTTIPVFLLSFSTSNILKMASRRPCIHKLVTRHLVIFLSLGPVSLTWIKLITTWMSNCFHYKMWDVINYPSQLSTVQSVQFGNG